MLRKVVEAMEKSNVRAKVKAGELMCPECGAMTPGVPGELGSVLQCGSCGTKASLSEWAAEVTQPIRRARADMPPPGTKIREDGDGLGGKVWEIPSKGKSGFLMVFASIFLGITGLVSVGFLYGSFFAVDAQHSSGTDTPDWVAIPFFGAFWAIGLGVLYAGLREKYLKSRVTVSGGEVRFTKELFGRAKVKAMPFASIKEIEQREFFQQNYKPVYGIEIRGDTGKIRFGSGLAETEKAWLVAALRESVFGNPEEKRIVPRPPVASEWRESFSVVVPGCAHFLSPLIFAAIGIGFLCIGIFVIEGESVPSRAEVPGLVYPFELAFALLGNGFRVIWLLISSSFALLGIGITVSMARDAGKEKRIEGNAEEVSIRSYKRGLVVEDKSFPRSEVTDIRTFKSGSSGTTVMKQVELIVGEKAEKIAGWMDGEKADALAAEVRRSLGVNQASA